MNGYHQKSFKKQDLELVIVDYLKRFGLSSKDIKSTAFVFIWEANQDVRIVWEEK